MASQKYRPRILEIYASSEEEAQKIRESARQSGQTISKFVMNVLRPALYHTDEGPSRHCLIEESAELQEEVRRLREDSRARDLLLARYEAELRRIRDNALLAPAGSAALDPALLQILRQGGPIHEHRLLDALHISGDDGKAILAISRQLSLLEASGFVAKGPNGWRWLG